MDHTAAQATFIEITFGLNSLFAVYDRFRKVLEVQFADRIKECSAGLKAVEPTGDSKRVARAVLIVEKVASKHLAFQKELAVRMIPISFICAVICVLVLYFDWLEALGRWNVILILPLPAYTVISAINYSIFHRRQERKMFKFKDFVNEFESDQQIELPPLPEASEGTNDSGSTPAP